ncbi:hypothetical protein EDC96DRAFT_570173 [Choanephora cucurbitarum]|nr:hypothetical protein EDC96DRAFT_570173 [Choanephora cucurbitarum]
MDSIVSESKTTASILPRCKRRRGMWLSIILKKVKNALVGLTHLFLLKDFDDIRFAHEYYEQRDTQPIVQDEEMEDFDGLSMSESSMETDTSNVVSEESITQEESVTYDWYPSEPIDQVKAA